MIFDSEQAQLNYYLAAGNLVLAGVDVFTVGGEGAKIARNLARNKAKAALVSRLSNKKITNLQKWANAKNPKQRQKLYNQLQKQLGDDFDEAIKYAETDLTSDTTKIFRDESLSSSEKLQQIRAKLTPEEQALFDRELAATTPDKYAAKLGNQTDPIGSIKGRVKKGAATETPQQRFDQGLDELNQSGFSKRKDIVDIANASIDYDQKVTAISSKIATEKAKQKAIAKYPASQGYQVLEEVNVAEAVGNYKTKAEWRAANPDADDPGLYESGGRIWLQKTDIDVMVVQKTPDGKYKTVEIQEVKSGKNDSPVKARGQSNNGRDGLQAINNGSDDVQLHQGKEDITGQFDRSQTAVSQDKAITVGAGQKKQGDDGFDQTSEYTSTDYNNLAKEILEQNEVRR